MRRTCATSSSPWRIGRSSVCRNTAVGDGVTDDTTALTNAIASGASTIYVPDGTYINSGVTMGNANQTLWLAPGATLKAKAATTTTVVTIAANGVTIKGGTIDGNAANVTSSAGIEIFGGGVNDACVKGVTVQNTTGYGIHGNHTQRARIVGNKVFNTGNIGIFLEATTTSQVISDNIITGNHVDRTAQGANLSEGGIKVHANGTSALAMRTRIANNTVLMPVSPVSGAAICIEVAYANDMTVIDGNTTSGGVMGISLDTATAGTVTGNTCYNASTYGIELAGTIRCTVAGNGIEGNGLTGIGIEVNDAGVGINDGNEVSGNSVNGCINAAIKFFKANSGSCSGNTGKVAVSGKQVVYLQNSSNISISGGHYDAGSTSSYAVLLLDSSNVTVTGAVLANAATSTIGIGSDTTGTYDNIVINGCNFIGAIAPVTTAMLCGGVLGNNVMVTNCTGVVGSGTTNGNARRGDCLDWNNQVWNFVGNGGPAGSVTAGPGSLYRNQAGGTSTTLYVKETGTGNTGWVAK
jgi:parallel beta-helix repeat protein